MKIKINKTTDCDRNSPRAIKGMCPFSEFLNPGTYEGRGGGGGEQGGCHPLEFF